MKKMFFYAAAAIVAFASCNKDTDVVIPNNGGEIETMEAIAFQMNSGFEVTTRGTGAVGDAIGSANNVWNGEKLNVFMFYKDTLALAENLTDGGAAYFDNDTVTAPKGQVSGVAKYDGVKYYASNDRYDFFAYHGDDAVTRKPTLVGDSVYTVPFTINGTQDLMVAKAKMTAAELEVADSTTEARAYSAYTARRGYQPTFAFNHALSRLVFNAIAMEAGVASKTAEGTYTGLSIDEVVIKNAMTEGTMTVAALKEDSLGIKFDKNSLDDLTLVDRDSTNMDPVTFAAEGDTVRLGESLLVAPGVTKYETAISYSQKKIKQIGTTDLGEAIYDTTIVKNTYAADIKLADNKPFVAGTQYKVYVKVYDNKEIELTVKLEGWKEGEDVTLDSEE